MRKKLEYLYYRYFTKTDVFVNWYLDTNHGSKKLPNGTWAVKQSDEFHQFCYNEAYKLFKK